MKNYASKGWTMTAREETAGKPISFIMETQIERLEEGTPEINDGAPTVSFTPFGEA